MYYNYGINRKWKHKSLWYSYSIIFYWLQSSCFAEIKMSLASGHTYDEMDPKMKTQYQKDFQGHANDMMGLPKELS